MLSRQAIERAAAVLMRGDAVILPTDTVPGLFVLDSVDGEKLIRRIKKRSETKPFARMFANRKQLATRVRLRSKLQETAVSTLLPGCVTLILPSAKKTEASLGVRIPDDSSLRALISKTGPLIATSANVSGQALRDPATLPKKLLSQVTLIEEDDDATYRGLRNRASTVIDLLSSRLAVIRRKGVVPIWTVARKLEVIPALESTLGLNILFVCGGNTCRSPMAVKMFKACCSDKRINVRGAGLSVVYDSKATDFAVKVMEEKGLVLQGHRARSLNRNLISWSDLILVMTRSHLMRVTRMYPEARGFTFLLSGFPAPWPSGLSIDDPIGMGIDVYRDTASRIESYLKKICVYLSKVIRDAD